jgi:ABC-type transport system involved in multi-copper enzyme maturation permease subunit
MTWLAWRQFRAQAILAAAATLVTAAVLVATHGRVAPTGMSRAVDSLQLLGTALIGLPAFIGAFWGAPLVAREIESGTHRLVWTQGVSRARWLAAKLAVAGVVAVVTTAVVSAVFSWWSQPLDAAGNRIGTANFGQRGVAPVAYALFALALGTLLGAVTKRTLPSMAATLVGFFVVRFAFQLLVRPHLLATSLVARGRTGGTWVLSSRSTAKVVHVHAADQFWALQGLEAAAFLGLAGVLAALCFWSIGGTRLRR